MAENNGVVKSCSPGGRGGVGGSESLEVGPLSILVGGMSTACDS